MGPVVNAAYVNKLTPPVNVDGAYLSVGGTISTGGFGGTSAHEGFQVDHVLELQVVTGDGQLIPAAMVRDAVTSLPEATVVWLPAYFSPP